MRTPCLGDTVLYRLTDYDCDLIAAHRAGSDGTFTGNTPTAGQACAATVVRVWEDTPGAVNLQVHLDGNHVYWVASCREGDEPGTWSWPPSTEPHTSRAVISFSVDPTALGQAIREQLAVLEQERTYRMGGH